MGAIQHAGVGRRGIHCRMLSRFLAGDRAPGRQMIPDSAVESEAQDKAQAFRSERNGPVPLSAVVGIGVDERRPQPVRTKRQVTKTTLKHYGSMRSLLQAHASLSTSHTIELRSGMMGAKVHIRL